MVEWCAGLFCKLSPTSIAVSLKARLYFIIAFLGLLPVLGLSMALFAVQIAQRDNAILDRTVRGALHLKEINGLVFAAVMESRGIYMSPDWKTAEPFAEKLAQDLSELQTTAAAWKSIAIAAQRSNVDELSRRIDQFVTFRNELLRLARDVGTDAARRFGDNAANRTVRSELNESLTIVARGYESEVARAREMIVRHDRNVLTTLSMLAALALCALVIGVALVSRGLLAPLSGMRRSMLRLVDGDLDSQVLGMDRSDEIGEMARSVAVFRDSSIERKKLNREAMLLSQLNEWLQSCKSLEELYQMVADFLAKLLPYSAGSLYIYANSRDVLDVAVVWNGGKAAHNMHPDDCWGLRRGHNYTYGEREIDFHCAHVGTDCAEHYCCIPILAHGETIGLLHLEFSSAPSATKHECERAPISDQRRLGLICAEQISMAIANVKLRDQLRDQSIRDVLTGLFNRRYMLETCRREFARAARAKQSVSILSIDADHFKKFNDNHGHDAGDIVLRALSDCLKQCFREEDIPCRYGGEEFVVVLPGATAEVAARRAEDLRAKVEALIVHYLDGILPKITVSIGVAAFPESGNTPQAVLKVADEALYRAKEQGRNRVANGTHGDVHATEDKPLSQLKDAA